MSSPVACSVRDLGPVVEFEGELAHGLNVLVGQQGAGKSTILRAVDLTVNGRADDAGVEKRVGASFGVAEVGPRTLKISRVTRTEGELSVAGVGNVSLRDLHWPALKDQSARDAARIRALCRLMGVTLNSSDFTHLLDATQLPDADSADAVSMTEGVKRVIDRAARDEEKQAAEAAGKAAAWDGPLTGVDVVSPVRIEELVSARDEAVRRHAALESLERLCATHEAQAAVNAVQIAALLAKVTDGAEEALVAARKSLSEATAECHAAEAEEAEARQALAAAKAKKDAARLRRDREVAAVEAARARCEEDAQSRAMLDDLRARSNSAAEGQRPTPEELAAASGEVDRATSAVKAEESRADKVAMAAHRDEWLRTATVSQKRAEALRRKAGKVRDVLAEAVRRIPECALSVLFDDDGKATVMADTDRGPVRFDELSDGERWRLIVPMAVSGGRLVVLSQAAFGELAPSTCQHIHELAQSVGGIILTARATDTPLRLVMYPEL